jgi:hypothetical protein
MLLVAHDHANAARTAAIKVFKALLLAAPNQLREPLRRDSTRRQTAPYALLPVHARHSPAERVLRRTLRSLTHDARQPRTSSVRRCHRISAVPIRAIWRK